MTRFPSRRASVLAGIAAIAVAAAGCSEAPRSTGDAVRGEQTHSACLACHGTEVYMPPNRKLADLAALRKEVERWGDYYNPALTPQDVDDVTAYLNRDFYKF